jgi:hypothetical protein
MKNTPVGDRISETQSNPIDINNYCRYKSFQNFLLFYNWESVISWNATTQAFLKLIRQYAVCAYSLHGLNYISIKFICTILDFHLSLSFNSLREVTLHMHEKEWNLQVLELV